MPFRSAALLAYLHRPTLAPQGDGRVPRGLPAALIAALTGAVLATPAAAVLALAGAALAGACLAQLMRWHYPHARIGACNAVTILRMALTASLLAPLAAGQGAGWAVAGVATVALALDGVDGFLARRSGLSSDFGARFDMEVDAALALILALHAMTGSAIGAEVLVLGIMRYVFVAAGVAHSAFRQPLPPSLLRKAICVLQLSALIVLQLPVVSADAAIVVGRIAAGALIWSFGTDAIWLWRHR